MDILAHLILSSCFLFLFFQSLSSLSLIQIPEKDEKIQNVLGEQQRKKQVWQTSDTSHRGGCSRYHSARSQEGFCGRCSPGDGIHPTLVKSGKADFIQDYCRRGQSIATGERLSLTLNTVKTAGDL